MIQDYEWQGEVKYIDGYGDSDWAGCKQSGKSTSGGIIMIGTHVIKSWSRSQKTVALSSGEAELTAMVKVTCESLGIAALLGDWGDPKSITVFADSNAALGVVRRKGAGRLRHVKVGMLWIQDLREDEAVLFKKVEGVKNPADLMTKHNPQRIVEEHCWRIKLRPEVGRSSLASKLSRGVKNLILTTRRSKRRG